MDFVATIAPHVTPYLTISGLTGRTYTYEARFKKRRFPVLNHTMHQEKCAPGAMLYMAVAADADVRQLKPGEKLYVGSQCANDRMFRGDGLDGENFHHAEMREGNLGQGLEAYVAQGGKVTIYTLASATLVRLAAKVPALRKMGALARGEANLPLRYHGGYWAEQLILRDEFAQWAWNTQPASYKALAVLREHGL